jgi:hypothetical protein
MGGKSGKKRYGRRHDFDESGAHLAVSRHDGDVWMREMTADCVRMRLFKVRPGQSGLALLEHICHK